jgi:hypothetical protein
MKGGKEGRKRRTGAGAPSGAPVPRGKAKVAGAKRPANAAPKKGSRKKTYGAVPSTDDA